MGQVRGGLRRPWEKVMVRGGGIALLKGRYEGREGVLVCARRPASGDKGWNMVRRPRGSLSFD